MLLLIQNILLTLLVEIFGVACAAGVLYVYWNYMTRKKS